MFFIKKKVQLSRKNISTSKNAEISNARPYYFSLSNDEDQQSPQPKTILELLNASKGKLDSRGKRSISSGFGPRPLQSRQREMSPICQPSTIIDFDGLDDNQNANEFSDGKPRRHSRHPYRGNVMEHGVKYRSRDTIKKTNLTIASRYHLLPDENHRLFDSFTRFVIQREMEQSLKARKPTISQTLAKIANQHLEPNVMSKSLLSTARGTSTPQSYKSPKKFKMRLKLSRQLAIDQNR